MMRQVFTLGELAQICPHRINKRLFLLMQSIIFQQGGDSIGSSFGLKNRLGFRLDSEIYLNYCPYFQISLL